MSDELQLPPGFSRNLPTIQNAIAIFNNWGSALPIPGVTAGGTPLFSAERDPRPSFLRDVFGSLDQLDILELGSYEGGHSYQLEKLLGAQSITSIEANAESFIKSLIIKEVLGLKGRFLYGDFVKYLETMPQRYDLIFACGVLYHMADPLHLLHLISQQTDRTFVWTHYVSVEESGRWADSFDVERYGFKCRYHRYVYDPNMHSRGYAGTETYCCQLLKDDILGALKSYGFEKIRVMADHPGEIGGCQVSIVAYR
jgi:hypothetical protein